MKKLGLIICSLFFSVSVFAQKTTPVVENLGLKNVKNARDIGGYQIDGKTIKKGLLFRSGDLSSIGLDDLKTLESTLNIGLIFDIRAQFEHDEYPDFVPDNVLYASIPCLSQTMKLFYLPENRKSTSNDELVSRIDYYLDSIDTKEVKMLAQNFYPYIINSRGFKDDMGEILEHMTTDSEGKAVLLHSSFGTHRVGWVVSFILAALGADRETITKEFLKSNEYYKEYIDYAVSQAKARQYTDEQIETVTSLISVSEKNLNECLDKIEEMFGSLDGYLTRVIKVDDVTKVNLKLMFLE